MGPLLLVLLTACGGGGGSAGTPNGAYTPGTSPVSVTTTTAITTTTVAVSTAADLNFAIDKTFITNTGLDKVVLTVQVVDANRNVVANVPVLVAVNSGAVFAATSSSTDSSGKYTGYITVGSDKTNRTINATITANGIVKVASVLVTGSQISITSFPVTPTIGQPTTVTFIASDSVGNPIPNVALAVSGVAGFSGTVITDLSGSAVVTGTAPSTSGTFSIIAAASGVSITKNLQVQAAIGAVPVAAGPITAVSLSSSPTSISPNTAGSTSSRARLSAKFLTTGNAGIPNMRVRFEIVQPALGNGEAISTGDTPVYSGASGLAEADYVAGTRSSPTNGVNVRICYSLADFTSVTACPNQLTATLTVAGLPLSISISDNNTLSSGLGGIAYVKQFLLQVNDSAGVAVANSIVSASVDITHYGKGSFNGIYPLGKVAPDVRSLSLATSPDGSTGTLVVTSTTAEAVSPGTLPSPSTLTGYYNVWCANEDLNRNGTLEVGEDTNGNGAIDPRKAEIIVSYVSGNKTDANGQMLIQVSYGQNVGRWLAYTIRATTSVAGSEGDASKSYITDVLAADLPNGSFLTPPYGKNACITVN